MDYYQLQHSKNYHCNNCNERGHLSKDCNQRAKQICILCGEFGHSWQHCPNVLCYNCKIPDHRAAQCPKYYCGTCYRCKMFGHTQLPAKEPLIKSNCNANERVYCYNCAEKGHYGHECTKERMNLSYPFVVSYDYNCTYTEDDSKRRKIDNDECTKKRTFAESNCVNDYNCSVPGSSESKKSSFAMSREAVLRKDMLDSLAL